jgi:hypothetical protein
MLKTMERALVHHVMLITHVRLPQGPTHRTPELSLGGWAWVEHFLISSRLLPAVDVLVHASTPKLSLRSRPRSLELTPSFLLMRTSTLSGMST